MALPLRTTGSLSPDFSPGRPVSLTVRQVYAIALYERFLTVLSLPSHASVTIWEATAPVKLPARHCPHTRQGHKVRIPTIQGKYPNSDSTETSVPTSKSPSYPVHILPKINVKLQ